MSEDGSTGKLVLTLVFPGFDSQLCYWLPMPLPFVSDFKGFELDPIYMRERELEIA